MLFRYRASRETAPGWRAGSASATVWTVSLTYLQSFVTVAEEGHVGRAARKLHLTQPPISRHILALEDELKTRLFERTPRGMKLLPAGEIFLSHARRILAEVETAVERTRGAGTTRPA